MFVSKLLNKLFFNTNNDCYFTTLLNLNPFMLTVNNHKAILDRSVSEDKNKSEDLSEESFGSSNDDALLKRKHEWATAKVDVEEYPTTDLSVSENGRCISPVPFPLTEQNTPENNFRPIGGSEPPKGLNLEGLLSKPRSVPRISEAGSVGPKVAEETDEPSLSEFSGAYSPKQPDTLFWCIFIIANGYGEYVNIDRNYGVKELEIKKKVCEFLQKNPSKLKHTNYKIAKAGVQEVISELLTSNKDTSFNCLLALCVYYNINIVLLHPKGKLMLEFLSYDQEETPYYVLKKDAYGKYSVDTDKKTWKDIQEMKTHLVCISNYMKPMKAAGNYKMEDLEELADKLGVLDATKKYKKAELYDLVSGSIVW
jgi:hypothetical protein